MNSKQTDIARGIETEREALNGVRDQLDRIAALFANEHNRTKPNRSNRDDKVKLLNNEVVILSAYTNNHTDVENYHRHGQLVDLLTDYGHTFNPRAIGSWEGVRERSVIVRCNGASDINSLLNVARKFSQEAILLVHSNRSGTIIDCTTGQQDYAGILRNISPEVALKEQGYTLIDGSYFVLRK